MINPQKLSAPILADLYENYTDEQISKMSLFEVFDAFLVYNGIIGYTQMILSAIENIEEASK